MQSNFKGLCVTLSALSLITAFVAYFFGMLDVSLVLGLALGSVFVLFYSFWVEVSVRRALKRQEKAAKRYIQKTYVARYLAFALCFGLAIKLDFINWWAFLIPVAGLKLYLFLIYNIANRKEG